MTTPPPPPFRLPASAVTPALLDALRDGAVVAAAPVAVFDLQGPGAVACFQGLLTNDLEKPGDGAFVYGALLTPKGMVVSDGWASRGDTRVTFTVPAAGREAVREIYTKSIPPRLARWRDRGDENAVLRIAGPRAAAVCERAGIPMPAATGRAVEALAHGVACEVAQAPPNSPFTVQVTTPAASAEAVTRALVDAGTRAGDAVGLELARILAGWPGLGHEIDDRTIPQEIRFDDIGGVSYTKGCYTGQETVSRLHFRGHTNRILRGLLFDAEPGDDPALRAGDRAAGRVTSVAWIPMGGPDRGRWIGLGMVRRELGPGAAVRAAGVDARVVDLPFELAYLEPA